MDENLPIEKGIMPLVLQPSELNRNLSPDKLSPTQARILQNCDLTTFPGRLRRCRGYVTTQVTGAGATVRSCFVAERRDGKLILLDANTAGLIRATYGDGTVIGTGPLPTQNPFPDDEDRGMDWVDVTTWAWQNVATLAILTGPGVTSVDCSAYFSAGGAPTSGLPYTWWRIKIAGPMGVGNVGVGYGSIATLGGWRLVANFGNDLLRSFSVTPADKANFTVANSTVALSGFAPGAFDTYTYTLQYGYGTPNANDAHTRNI